MCIRDRYIFWTSSDEAVATVTDSGVVTAMADGTAAITAKSWYGHEATCAVTVKTPDEPTPPQPTDPWPTEGLAGFVTRCYRVALSRDPDKAGHADWVRWLQAGTVDATACTYGSVSYTHLSPPCVRPSAIPTRPPPTR